MKPKSASFDAGATQSATTGMHTDTSLSNDRSDGAVDNLKRQYAAGNLSEEELDQRVENLLHVDEVASQAKEKRRRKESTGVSRQRERN